MMEIVINISQESYNNLKIGCTQRVSDAEMIEAIKNGTPLPKGRGFGFEKRKEMTFLEQEREARAYNNAFLHGKEVGLKFGREIAINEVLEIIDKEDDYFDQLIRRGEVADLDDIYERIRDAVLALKGGTE